MLRTLHKMGLFMAFGLSVMLFSAGCNLFNHENNPTSPMIEEDAGISELGNALYSGTGFVYPVDTKTTGGYFGWLSKTGNSYHLGADLKIGVGAPVYAISDGVVVAVSWQYVSGQNQGGALVVKHRLSNGTYFTALYGHITPGKSNGAVVKAGERIGTITNCYTTQYGNVPHLHFEIHPNPNVIWTPAYTSNLADLKGCVDPLSFLEANRPMNGTGSTNTYFAQYDDKDPIQAGCTADGITVASANIYSGGVRVALVEQRWSNRCGTNWGKVTRYDGRNGETMRVEIQRSNPAKTVVEQLAGYNQIYTNMVYARSIPARTCATVRGVSACTIWK